MILIFKESIFCMQIKEFKKYPEYRQIKKKVKKVNSALKSSMWDGRFLIDWDNSEGFISGDVSTFLIAMKFIDTECNNSFTLLLPATTWNDINVLRLCAAIYIEEMLKQSKKDKSIT